MNQLLDQSRFAAVLSSPTPKDRGMKFLRYVEDQIRQDSWQDFHDDVFAIPACARRLYLALCFDIGVRGDGMDTAFSFYGNSGDSLILEVMEGFCSIGLAHVAEIIGQALRYWRNPDSPMHVDSVPWRRMDEDLDDIHGRYFREAEGLFSIVGTLVGEWGEERIHRREA